MSKKNKNRISSIRAASFNAQLDFLEGMLRVIPARVFLSDKLQRAADTLSDKNITPAMLHQIRTALSDLMKEVSNEINAPIPVEEQHMVLSIAESVKTAQRHQKECVKQYQTRTVESE